jgi:hypothetical protein
LLKSLHSLKNGYIFVPTNKLKHKTMTTKTQKVQHISRTIQFKKSPNKGKYFMEPKLLDYLIDKFTKETKCKFVDFDLVNDKKIVLMGVIK